MLSIFSTFYVLSTTNTLDLRKLVQIQFSDLFGLSDYLTLDILTCRPQTVI